MHIPENPAKHAILALDPAPESGIPKQIHHQRRNRRTNSIAYRYKMHTRLGPSTQLRIPYNHKIVIHCQAQIVERNPDAQLDKEALCGTRPIRPSRIPRISDGGGHRPSGHHKAS